MKIIQVRKYITPFGVVEFFPRPDMPEKAYRVVIDNQAMWWLIGNSVRPDKKMARFYARMKAARDEGRDEHYYVDQNIDPPLRRQNTQGKPFGRIGNTLPDTIFPAGKIIN
jgi:hypothetical protein